MAYSARATLNHHIVVRKITPFDYDFIFDDWLERSAFADLLKFLEKAFNNPPKKFPKHKKLIVSCSLIDVYNLMKDYSLVRIFDYNSIEDCTYGDTHHAFPKNINTYVICKKSKYGSSCFNLNIGGYYVQTVVEPKSLVYKKSLNLQNPEKIELSKLVFFDIETTGLSEFDDDIIEIAFYDFETKQSFCRKLPLRKRDSIPESISKINHITNEMIKEALPLSQDDIFQLIKTFKLDEKYIAVWTGNNLFDASFLKIYFLDNNLKGFESFRFFNLKSFVQQNKLIYSHDYSKDYIATHLGISVENAHSALEDCKIEASILSKVIEINDKTNLDSTIIKELIEGKLTEENSEDYYDRMIEYCRRKNGVVICDFDDPNLYRRGYDCIDIHHIDETIIDDIATRTNNAIDNRDKKTIEYLEKYNKASRLVYATIVEHFLLHYIIEFIRGPGGGPHWLFGYLLRAKFNVPQNEFDKNTFGKIESCYTKITFEQIVNIYKRILKKDKLSRINVEHFYKLTVISKELDGFIDHLFD